MITFIYKVGSNEKYVFSYHSESKRASVNYPNGTTSEAEQIQDTQMFGDWVDSILGAILPLNTLSLFQYVFNQEIKRGKENFSIQAAYLVSNCMTDNERDGFKLNAIKLDNEYYTKTGNRFDLGPVQSIYIARHRMDAHLLLEQFSQVLKLN